MFRMFRNGVVYDPPGGCAAASQKLKATTFSVDADNRLRNCVYEFQNESFRMTRIEWSLATNQ